MAGYEFIANRSNFAILRKRIKELFEDDTHWGAGRLLKEATKYRPFSQNPSTYRGAINKFLNEDQRTINTDVAASIWDMLISKYPNETLNSQGDYLDVSTHQFSHALRDFYAVEKPKAAERYAPSLVGEYLMVRQAWRPNLDQVAVGKLRFTIAEGTGGHVIVVDEWVSGRPEDRSRKVDDDDPELEHSTGYAFPKGSNIFLFLKSFDEQPKIYVIHGTVPAPSKAKPPFRELKGAIIAGIGIGPHYAYEFHAHRLPPGRHVDICTKRPDDDLIAEFGRHNYFWLSKE